MFGNQADHQPPWVCHGGGQVRGTDACGGIWLSYRSATRPREVVLLSADDGWQVAWGRHQIQDNERPECVAVSTA